MAALSSDETILPSVYELERAALIARNQERLAQLGLSSGSALLSRVYEAPRQGSKQAPRLQKVSVADLPAPVFTRIRSNRVVGSRAMYAGKACR